ncbi:resolvase [Escherichia coli]|nr:resolvase [Escherichia coli]CAD5645342.1 resolvase [Escherichia coli]
MSRIFAYCRVSTLEQTTENQRREIESAGFNVKPQRIIEEQISGSVAASERPGFNRLLDRLESGDVLIVIKLDRHGRNAMDIRKTVEQLTESGIRVHCLALGGVDLTSPAGKMTMQVISAVAEFERTYSRIARARDAGKRFGRPPILKQKVLEHIKSGASISAIAREFRTTRQTILRVRAKQQMLLYKKIVLAWDIFRFPSGPQEEGHNYSTTSFCCPSGQWPGLFSAQKSQEHLTFHDVNVTQLIVIDYYHAVIMLSCISTLTKERGNRRLADEQEILS